MTHCPKIKSVPNMQIVGCPKITSVPIKPLLQYSGAAFATLHHVLLTIFNANCSSRVHIVA